MFRSKRPAEMRAMPEGKPPTPLEDDAEECLHCAIVDMVDERIAAGGADAANLAALIAESLVDVILRVRRRSRRSLWRTRWRLWAISFFRRAVRTKAAPDRRTKRRNPTITIVRMCERRCVRGDLERVQQRPVLLSAGYSG